MTRKCHQGKCAVRDMGKELWLQNLQSEIDKFNADWGGNVDYRTELEVIDGQNSYLVELVDFNEVLSEIYYEFQDTYHNIIEKMGDAVQKDTGDTWFYFEPYDSLSDVIGRAWPTTKVSNMVRRKTAFDSRLKTAEWQEVSNPYDYLDGHALRYDISPDKYILVTRDINTDDYAWELFVNDEVEDGEYAAPSEEEAIEWAEEYMSRENL